MKKVNNFAIVVGIMLSSILLGGCWRVNHKFVKIKNIILSTMDNQYRTDTEFGLGSVSLAAARVAVNFSHDKDSRMAKEILANISKVQIGVYKNAYNNGNLNMSFLNRLDEEMKTDGWYYIVKNCEHGQITAVYAKDNGREIKELFVINVERHKVNLVNVEGNLTQAVLVAVREKGLDINL